MTFVIGKMKLATFSLFLGAFSPRLKVPFTYVVSVSCVMSLSKGHLGSRGGGGHLGSRGGGASRNKLKDTSFIFPITNVTILGVFRTHALKEYDTVCLLSLTF